MKWFDTNVASSDAALQETPEVFESVGVNLPINVFLGVVNDFVGIFLSQSIVGCQSIGVQGRASFDVLFNASLECRSLSVWDYYSPNFAATRQRSKYNGLVFSASTSDAP